MTLEDLSYKFFKAHMLMGIGVLIGNMIADMYYLKYPLLIGLLMGLLVSIRIYRQCVAVMIEEYKRLKSKKDEKKNIS